jgi:hypothetical protein
MSERTILLSPVIRQVEEINTREGSSVNKKHVAASPSAVTTYSREIALYSVFFFWNRKINHEYARLV